MKPVSLKVSAEERAEQQKAMTADYKAPEYGWGTSLHLEGAVLKKLGLDVSKLKAGQKLCIEGCAEVQSLTVSDGEGGKRESVSLQITELAAEPEGSKSLAASMYGGEGD